MTWTETHLGKLLEVEHGYAFKGEFFSEEGSLVVLTPGNFNEEGGFKPRPGKDRYYTANFPERYLLAKDDLITAMTEQAEGLLGSTALIPEDNRYLLNQRLGRIHPITGKADKRFLYYLFNTNVVRQQIRNSSSGAKVRHTSPTRIYQTKVRVPDIETQRKIAGILSAYDDLIENNRRRIAILERMAEELYHEWFVRMRFPGYQNTKFVKGVPEGWEYVLVDKAFSFTGGGTPAKNESSYWTDGEVNWFTPSDITASEGIFLPSSLEKCNAYGVEKSSARLFPAYSIMLTSRATIGAIGINTTEACTNQGFITCIPNDNYPLVFLYYWLKLSVPYFELLSGGATFKELTKSTFKKMSIITPTRTTVEKFEEIARPIFRQVESLERASSALKATRDFLLGRLISGRKSISEGEIKLPPRMTSERELAHA